MDKTETSMNKEIDDQIKELSPIQLLAKGESTFANVFVLPGASRKDSVPVQTNRTTTFIKPPIFEWTSAANLLKNKKINGHINKERSNSSSPCLDIELANHSARPNIVGDNKRAQEKPRLSLQKLRRTRVGTNASTHRPVLCQGSVGTGTLEKAIFHREEIGSGNDSESRTSSSYGIRTLFSQSQPHSVSQTHEKLEKLYTKEELRDYHQMFQMFDTDGSGALGNEELKEAMNSIGLKASKKEINDLIEEVDENGNGEIDFEEFCHCMKKSQNRVKKATNEEVARQCFEVFDQDGNGLITESEFIYVAKEIGGFSNELAEHVFQELDISSNGHLSSDQFSAIVEDYLMGDNKPA